MDNNVSSLGKQIISAVEKVLLGQRNAVEAACCCFFAGGHLLIEDAPGTGKTTLARALAKAAGGVFRRVQFTSDLLPTDITGVSVFDADAKTFRFQKGPVFCNVLLADEINRATPKTQSALLEAMSEKSISVEGSPLLLPSPFMVIATENEQEHHGTYPLPESQLDRFLMRLSMGYPDLEAERKIISRKSVLDPVEDVEEVLCDGDASRIAPAVDEVHVDKSIVDYILTIVKRTRNNDLLSLGAGPRGGMALHRAARALALIRGRDYCLVDDVKALAIPVLAHRIIPASDVFGISRTSDSASRIVRDILDEVEIPT
jgi:MoxR-like ATPase